MSRTNALAYFSGASAAKEKNIVTPSVGLVLASMIAAYLYRWEKRLEKNDLKNILRTSYEHLTNILQTSYEHLTNILQTSYKHLTILQTSYEHLTNILLTSYEHITNILWTSYEHLMSILHFFLTNTLAYQSFGPMEWLSIGACTIKLFVVWINKIVS